MSLENAECELMESIPQNHWLLFPSGKMSSSEEQNGGLKNTKQEALCSEIHTLSNTELLVTQIYL